MRKKHICVKMVSEAAIFLHHFISPSSPPHRGGSRKMRVRNKKTARVSHYHKHKISVVKFFNGSAYFFSAHFCRLKVVFLEEASSTCGIIFFFFLKANTKINTHASVWFGFSDGFSREEQQNHTRENASISLKWRNFKFERSTSAKGWNWMLYLKWFVVGFGLEGELRSLKENMGGFQWFLQEFSKNC